MIKIQNDDFFHLENREKKITNKIITEKTFEKITMGNKICVKQKSSFPERNLYRQKNLTNPEELFLIISS